MHSRQLTTALKFLAVGGVGFVVDVVVFNALRSTALHPDQVVNGPLVAKVISTSAAIVTNWIGNRLWAFRTHRSAQWGREFVEFIVASLVGMGVAVGTLAVSHYVLGFHSQLADNISGNVIGLLLGTIVRYLGYRFWVFSPSRNRRTAAQTPTESRATSPQ